MNKLLSPITYPVCVILPHKGHLAKASLRHKGHSFSAPEKALLCHKNATSPKKEWCLKWQTLWWMQLFETLIIKTLMSRERKILERNFKTVFFSIFLGEVKHRRSDVWKWRYRANWRILINTTRKWMGGLSRIFLKCLKVYLRMSKWIRPRSKLRGSRAVYKVNLLKKMSFSNFNIKKRNRAWTVSNIILYSRIALKVEYNGDLRKTWNGVEVLLHHSSSKLEFKSIFNFFSGT